MLIGVLALQGAFIEHINKLKSMGIDTIELRNKGDLEKPLDGVILPGGESTVMLDLLVKTDMFGKLKSMIDNGLPVFGTCAGMIMLAKHAKNNSRKTFEILDINLVRNGFGRHAGSFWTESKFNGVMVEMPFIRAPYITSVGPGVDILSQIEEKIVAVKSKNILATAFHPELTKQNIVHDYFIDIIKSNK